MKILAATETPYGRTRYIVDLESTELNCLTILSQYSDLPVKNAKGEKVKLDKDKLKAGDEIEIDEVKTRAENIQTFLAGRNETVAHMTQLKGAITKLQNSLP